MNIAWNEMECPNTTHHMLITRIPLRADRNESPPREDVLMIFDPLTNPENASSNSRSSTTQQASKHFRY